MTQHIKDLRTRIEEYVTELRAGKNKRIREFFEKTAPEQIHKNLFSWGKLRIRMDPDSPIKGVEIKERLYVSVYDPGTDTMLQFSVSVDAVQIEENALGKFNAVQAQ